MAREPGHLTKSRRLRELALELETLADAYEQPSRSWERAERLIGECERIGSAVRAVARGKGLA